MAAVPHIIPPFKFGEPDCQIRTQGDFHIEEKWNAPRPFCRELLPSALARRASSPLLMFRPAADYHHPDCIIPRASKLLLDPANCELPTSFLRSYLSLRSSGVIVAHPMNTNMSMKTTVM
jgi:hypothetical protein